MADPTSVAAVREYIGTAATTGQFGAGPIGSNIVVAAARLQRITGRQFAVQSATTKTFTTRGRPSLTIPDLTSASAVVLNGSALVANSTYYLIPDAAHTGIFTAIDLPAYRDRSDYRTYSDWFDKGYDSPLARSRLNSPLPNDLAITGEWGWVTYPPEYSFATMVLAAWLTKRVDAVLSNVLQSPDGNVMDLSHLPPEVEGFIRDWSIGAEAVVTV